MGEGGIRLSQVIRSLHNEELCLLLLYLLLLLFSHSVVSNSL